MTNQHTFVPDYMQSDVTKKMVAERDATIAELLAALNAIVEANDFWNYDDPVDFASRGTRMADIASAAIAKAEGK